MLTIDIYRRSRLYIHSVFWIIYVLLVPVPGFLKVAWPWKLYFPVHVFILVATTYFNFTYLINRYFNKEHYRSYFRHAFIVYVVGSCSIFLLITALSFFPLPEKIPVSRIYISSLITYTIEYTLLVTAKLAKEWYLKYETIRKRQLENMQAELRLLRTQLDPHFIFNTLNNIYLLSLNISPKTSDSILMLSELLNYILYESHEENVAVSKEIEFIESYISLQKLRLGDEQNIIFKKEGVLDYDIPPLIIFNFVENAFKHAYGIRSDENGTYYIFISVIVADNFLHLKVKNGKRTRSVPSRNGIGIANTVKRLSLIYADTYHFEIEDDEHIYSIQLKVPVR